MNKIMKKILVVVISLALLETNVFADNNVIFEKNNRIEVMRNPSLTGTGKPSTFMTEGHGNTVSVKWVK